MARKKIDYGVVIDWDETQVHRFIASPNGELGRDLMAALGEIVLAGAKSRSLKWHGGGTGRMVEAMRSVVGTDEAGVYADVISPAQNPKSGFPYPITIEGRKIRARRPHRTLRPALRDIRKIETR